MSPVLYCIVAYCTVLYYTLLRILYTFTLINFYVVEIRSSCVQNYSPSTILTTSLPTSHSLNSPTFINVKVPVSCSCFVKDFVFY